MRKSIIYFIGSLIIALIMFISNYQITHWHEEIHKTIYEHYGIESEIEYDNFGLSGETRAYYKEGQCPEMCKFAHELNEIVEYNVLIVLETSLFIVFICFLVKTFVYLKEEEDQIGISI